jgi:hypothetical protein
MGKNKKGGGSSHHSGDKRKHEPSPPSEDFGDFEYSEEEFSSESEGAPVYASPPVSSDDLDDSQGIAAEVWTYIRAIERSRLEGSDESEVSSDKENSSDSYEEESGGDGDDEGDGGDGGDDGDDDGKGDVIHPAQVGLAEAQQIRVARSRTVQYAHPTQGKAQSPQNTSPMGEGWLFLLKWLPPLKLSEVG